MRVAHLARTARGSAPASVTSSADVASSAMISARLQQQRHRDHDPLAHAPRELVGVVVESLRRVGDADLAEQVDDSLRRTRQRRPRRLLGMAGRDLEQLAPDRHRRVQRAQADPGRSSRSRRPRTLRIRLSRQRPSRSRPPNSIDPARDAPVAGEDAEDRGGRRWTSRIPIRRRARRSLRWSMSNETSLQCREVALLTRGTRRRAASRSSSPPLMQLARV